MLVIKVFLQNMCGGLHRREEAALIAAARFALKHSANVQTYFCIPKPQRRSKHIFAATPHPQPLAISRSFSLLQHGGINRASRT